MNFEQRLRARPKERGFTSDEAIRPHIEYNQWIGRNRGKYQLFINNEGQSEEKTARMIKEYITALPAIDPAGSSVRKNSEALTKEDKG